MRSLARAATHLIATVSATRHPLPTARAGDAPVRIAAVLHAQTGFLMTDQPEPPADQFSATTNATSDPMAPERRGRIDHPELEGEFHDALALTETETPATSSKARKVLMSRWFQFGLAAVILVLVIWLLAKEIHPDQVKNALSEANLWWVVVAFLAGALSWVGAAVPFRALSSVRIPWGDAIGVQMASSFVGVAAPSGLGPVALHLDYLKRRGAETAPAIAVVALIQIAQVVTSVTMLAVALPFDNDFPKMDLPLRKILIIAVLVLAALSVLLVVRRVREFLLGKLKEYWGQVQPQIGFVKERPITMLWSFLGVVLQTGATALALVLCMEAVGSPISLAMGITIYLVGNTVGGAVPVPGGIGTTLAATVGALTLAGAPTALAATGTLLFRLVTFYLQVPIGAVAFGYMQRKHLL